MTSRRAAVAALSLVAAGLGAVALAPPPAAAEPFDERWCADLPAPCVLSATRNGVPLTSADPEITIEMIRRQNTPDFKYTTFLVQSTTGALSLTDTYSITFDLGTMKPDYTEGYASRPDVDRIDDGDGTYRLTYTGRPVLVTSGCSDTYPSVCPETAADQRYYFSAEIQEKKTNLEFVGFDRSQSVDSVNGIFLVDTGSGPAYLDSEWANSHYLTDGTTVVRGEARFRIPYAMLTSDFGVPDPATMTASSMVGTINGSPAAFAVTQDPDGGGVYVDIDGVTFSTKKVRLKRGAIKPTRTTITKAKRVAPARARLVFERSTPRGARVTGYEARCVSGKAVRSATGPKRAFRTGLAVTGLRAGKGYSCQVRPLSKAGPGRWSKAKKV